MRRENTTAWNLAWDFDNKMKSTDIDSNDSADVNFQYDALGRRVARTGTGGSTVYLQMDQQTIADYPVGGTASTPTYRYVYASDIDEPVVRKGAGIAGTILAHPSRRKSQAQIFPSSVGNFERQLAIEFKKNGCKRCNIAQYSRGHPPAAHRDAVRRRIENLTGCSLWGSTELCKVDKSPQGKTFAIHAKKDGEPRSPNQKDSGKFRQPKIQVYGPIITTR